MTGERQGTRAHEAGQGHDGEVLHRTGGHDLRSTWLPPGKAVLAKVKSNLVFVLLFISVKKQITCFSMKS